MSKFITNIIVLSDAGSGPSGWNRISKDVEFDQTGIPKDQEHLRRLEQKTKKVAPTRAPSTPAEKGGKPENLVEEPKFDDMGFPQGGDNALRLPEKRDESLPFLARVMAKSSKMFFQDFLRLIKDMFPGLVMSFPKPPTYRWKPKDATAPLDVREIKDSLKVKFPNLKWSNNPDGSEKTELEFPDDSYVEISIGAEAYHLTIIYYIEDEQPEV